MAYDPNKMLLAVLVPPSLMDRGAGKYTSQQTNNSKNLST